MLNKEIYEKFRRALRVSFLHSIAYYLGIFEVLFLNINKIYYCDVFILHLVDFKLSFIILGVQISIFCYYTFWRSWACPRHTVVMSHAKNMIRRKGPNERM